MTQEEKLIEIINWFSGISEEETKQLAKQESFERTAEIEELIGESLPQEVLDLFTQYDGEAGTGIGSFLGHSLMGLDKMISNLEFAKTQVKPKEPVVSKPEESNAIIEKLIKSVTDEISSKKKFGFIKRRWFKVEFETGPDSMGGPYLYRSETSSRQEKEIIRLSDKADSEISNLTQRLHALELQEYNWDNLEIAAYADGRYEINRTYYDFDNQLPLTSTPEGAIKRKYFHIKWIPIISDGGGNYIGIDLDPDEKGTKGQVIIFGRDEEDMLVLSNSWSEFLDFNLEIIKNGGKELKAESHLHDIYKKLKSG